jgi:GNAT superfamily N-acetyltransferase
MIQLIPITDEKYQLWLDHTVSHYAQEHVQNGNWPVEDALRLAREETQSILKDGPHTKDNFIYTITKVESGQDVGNLWFAMVERYGKRRAFIYDVEIAEAFRRHGYAFQAFQQLEPIARELGAQAIALHVFGFNMGARALYEKLGFAMTNIQMEKKLSEADV